MNTGSSISPMPSVTSKPGESTTAPVNSETGKVDWQVLAIVSALVLPILLLIPLQVFFNNITELSAELSSLLPFFLLTSLTLSTLLYLATIKVSSPLVLACITLLSVVCFLESRVFFPLADHRPFDGQPIDWTALRVLSILEWSALVVLAILAFVLRKRKELLFSISAFVLLFYGTLLLYTTFSKWDAIQRGGQNYLSQFYRVSKQRNIVQIVADHTQSSLVYEILASDLERYSEVFDGFTLFTQAAGKYPSTYPAVPFYMTGRAPSVGVNVIPSIPYTHDYIRSLLRDCSFVKTLAENGFHTFAFQLSPLYCQGEYTACTSGPIFEGRSVTSTRMVETMRNAYRLLDVTLFQITPVTLRRHIHNDDQWFLSQLTKKQHTPSGILDLFIDSLEANDFPGSYNYFHHAGGHPPIQFDEHCQFIGTKKWNYENTRAQIVCFLLQLERLVRKLKEQDIYDQSFILVNGDHGSQWVTPLVKSRTGSIVQTRIITSANPLLFVKPRGTRGSLRFSNAPVSIGDIPATVNHAFGLNGDFPGIPIFDISESDERERIYLWYKPRPEVFMEQKLPRTMPYRIRGNLFNQYNWIPPYLSDLENAPFVLPMGHENFHEFAQGFSELEEGSDRPARWVEGRLARAYLSLPEKGKAQLVLECSLPPGVKEQSVKVSLNGNPVTQLEDADLRSRSRHVILLPGNLPGQKVHIIEFNLAQTAQREGDPRELSLLVRYLGLERVF